MAEMTSSVLLLIIVSVSLAGVAGPIVLDRWRWLRNKGPTVHGTRIRLVFMGVLIWTAAVSVSGVSLVVASILVPSITVLAILFGLQAVLLELCSRVSYRRTSAQPGGR